MQQTLSYSSSSPSPSPMPTPGAASAPPNPDPSQKPTTPKPKPRPRSTAGINSFQPAVIPVDYSYSTHSHAHTRSILSAHSMAPSTFASNQSFVRQPSVLDGQPYSSLFGDPVPPPLQADDYFGTAAFEALRSGSVDLPSSEEDALMAAVALNALLPATRERIFPSVPYSRSPRRSLLPHLQPPDIQILPNSSGGSSSEHLGSPNYCLLAPDDILNKPDMYELENASEEYTSVGPRLSFGNEDDEDVDVEPARTPSQMAAKLSVSSINTEDHRGLLSDTYSGRDWFRPAPQHFPEFTRIPRLRPSSKNIMSMKQDEGPLSPLATMIQDMNSSSSGGEERGSEAQGNGRLEVARDLVLSPKQYLEEQLILDLGSRQRGLQDYDMPPPPAAPPPFGRTSLTEELEDDQSIGRASSLKREMSPVIIRDSIPMGGDYRVDQPRPHKKTAFTILSPGQAMAPAAPPHPRRISQSTTPSKRHASIQSTSTTTSSLLARISPRRRSIFGSDPRLPELPHHLTTDDSPRPSVQFNMSGRYSKLATPQKGILQQRDSLTSSIDTFTPRDLRRRGSVGRSPARGQGLPYGQKIKSMESLPVITDPYRSSSIPRLHYGSNVELDVGKEQAVFPPGALPRPLKPNLNPTRSQRGLLKIINKEEPLSTHPPRSNWTSLDDLSRPTAHFQARRRSSSTSPERRSSTQTASDRRSSNLSTVTTSDFSFRRPSSLAATLPGSRMRRKSIQAPSPNRIPNRIPSFSPRRQSIFQRDSKPQSRHGKIAKPSTLSPIIGTPNKDSSSAQSPTHRSSLRGGDGMSGDTPSEVSTGRRDSISRIPIRKSPESRSSSPVKDSFGITASGRSSRASISRSPTRAMMNPSRTPSRESGRLGDSRSVSRGPPSRPTSRLDHVNSRQDMSISRGNSRANSRLSINSSSLRSSSVSPATMARNRSMPNRRKSISPSPASSMMSRRKSISPGALSQARRGAVTSRGKPEKPDMLSRRNSRSRIPTREGKSPPQSSSTKKRSKSPEKAKTPGTTPRSSRAGKVAAAKSQGSPKSKVKIPASAKAKPKTETTKKTPAKPMRKTPTGAKPASETKKGSPPKEPKAEKGKEKDKDKEKTKPGAAKKNGKEALAATKTKTPLNKSKAPGGAVTETKKPGGTKAHGMVLEKGANGSASATDIPPLAAQVGNAVLQAVEAVPAVTSEVPVPSTPGGKGSGGGNMSKLVRMSSRLSLLSNKNRADSPQSRKVATVPEHASESEGAHGSQPMSNDAAAILEKSQKTLETIQKTVTEATDEIHKTITENLTDLKSLENDLAEGASPTPSSTTMVARTGESASRTGTADGSIAPQSSGEQAKSPFPPTQPIEAAVSVLHPPNESSADRISSVPEAECESSDIPTALDASEAELGGHVMPTPESGADFKVDAKRRSPDGQGGSTAGSGGPGKSSSQEFLEEKDNNAKKRGLCGGCCTKLFMPCRRSRCSRCCCLPRDRDSNGNLSAENQPVLWSGQSSATTATNVQVIDETKPKKRRKCTDWLKSSCCRSCRKKPGNVEEEQPVRPEQQKTNMSTGPKARGKCGLCLSKVFCCRSVNKVDPTTGDETEVKKCCFCIPCRGRGSRSPKKGSSVSWRDQDPELGIKPTESSVLEGASEAAVSTASNAVDNQVKEGCCKRFWLMLLCCRKKKRRESNARRQSIKAPPPSEDTRKKLHVDLVEYTSKMKGAIPVLPLYLAWFCAFCNVVFPGLGTLLSGLFCLCVGIPRFSQFDSARARIGSFIINIIVAVSQFFCVLFCFVGWGWSIWWGTIMLRCAKKLSKIKKVERLELEEEQRQAQLAATVARNGDAEAAPAAAVAKT
ncbi:hypothetical protein KR074_001356 [Drosophila pseudoananassae]|nr:hypothetical protein KR074_001356 [Drosophila pseudoananassae]